MTLAVFLGDDGLAVVLYATAPTGFFPQQDTGFIQGVVLDLPGRLLRQDGTARSQQVGDVIAQDPDVAGVGILPRPASPNQANLNISLKPRDRAAAQQRRPDHQRACGPSSRKWSACRRVLQAAQDINVGGRAGQAQYQYTLSRLRPRRAEHLGAEAAGRRCRRCRS